MTGPWGCEGSRNRACSRNVEALLIEAWESESLIGAKMWQEREGTRFWPNFDILIQPAESGI